MNGASSRQLQRLCVHGWESKEGASHLHQPSLVTRQLAPSLSYLWHLYRKYPVSRMLLLVVVSFVN